MQRTSQCHDIFLMSDWLVYAVRAILYPETNLKRDLRKTQPSVTDQNRTIRSHSFDIEFRPNLAGYSLTAI